jgi:hypothetical protein
LEKVLLEYEQSDCSKVEKKVTITSMVIKESNEAVTPCLGAKQAFDCDQKQTLRRPRFSWTRIYGKGP